MIYLDTSVALAHLFKEAREPSASFWSESLVSSRLLEVELWVRLNARGLGTSHGEAARTLLGRVSFLELAPPVIARVLDPFPSPVRTLDAIHLASMQFLRERRQTIVLASYDERLNAAARELGIPIAA